MTKFRALLGALATGTLILAFTQSVYAAPKENDITGTQSIVDGACVAPTAFFSGLDCSYNATSPWLGIPISAWQGPSNPATGYYQVGQSPFVNGAVDGLPVVGDSKYAAPFLSGSTITIEDNGSVCNADDQISGSISLGAATRAFSGGPGSRGEESWGDGDIIFPIPVTTVDAATPDGAGGCDYEIASAGFPPLLQSINGGTYIFDAEIVPAPPLPDQDSWVGPASVGAGCSLTLNCGVSVPVTVGAGWSCTDNTGGTGACAPTQGHYQGTRATLENFLIAVSTNSNGDITAGTIFANNESNVAVTILPDPNSWDGALLTFTGTCNNCKLASDDVYSILGGLVANTLDIGANDSSLLENPTTITITVPPPAGSLSNLSAPGDIKTMTVDYTPPSATFVGQETFEYEVNDNVNEPATAMVTVNVETNSIPEATDVIRTISTLGVDPTTVTDTFNLLTSPGNDPGNGGLVDNPTNVVNGTATTNGIDASFTPSASFIDSGSYTYTITDEQNDVSDPAGTVTILADPEDPTALDATAVTDAGVPVDIPILFELGNGSAAQHTVLAIANSGTCTVNLTTAIATYEPDDGFSGDDSCTYTISDIDGSSDDGIIIITVEDTVAILFPSGNAVDPWSLALLIWLPLLRRRRTP